MLKLTINNDDCNKKDVRYTNVKPCFLIDFIVIFFTFKLRGKGIFF